MYGRSFGQAAYAGVWPHSIPVQDSDESNCRVVDAEEHGLRRWGEGSQRSKTPTGPDVVDGGRSGGLALVAAWCVCRRLVSDQVLRQQILQLLERENRWVGVPTGREEEAGEVSHKADS